MNAPLVSCIVPVYNGARFVGEALDSILAQSHQPLDVIAVDDGSTDATPAVLASFAGRIRSVRQPNQGPSAARNSGIVLARGSFIAFLDCDDLWHADKLRLQLARFAERPELEVCFAHFRNVGTDDLNGEDPLLDPDAWPVSAFSPCTFLGRRSVFERVGPYNPALRRGEDTEWFARMMMQGVPYEAMPDVLVERRIHGGNLSRGKPPSAEAVLDVLKLVLDRRRAEGW